MLVAPVQALVDGGTTVATSTNGVAVARAFESSLVRAWTPIEVPVGTTACHSKSCHTGFVPDGQFALKSRVNVAVLYTVTGGGELQTPLAQRIPKAKLQQSACVTHVEAPSATQLLEPSGVQCRLGGSATGVCNVQEEGVGDWQQSRVVSHSLAVVRDEEGALHWSSTQKPHEFPAKSSWPGR